MRHWPSLLLLFVLSSCVDDLLSIADKASRTSEATWSTHIAVPLAHATLGMDDLIQEKGDLVEHRIGSDGLITLIYESNLFSLRAEETYTLEDQTYNEVISLNAAQLSALSTNGSVSFSVARDVGLNYFGMELDSIIYKGGSWNIDVRSTLEHDVQVRVELLHSELNGQGIDQTLQANYSGTLPVVSNTVLDLDGAEGDLTQGPQGHSQLQLVYHVDITEQAGNTIKPVESIAVDMALNNQAYRFMKGRLYNANLSDHSDSLQISLFNNTEDGTFTLVDPKVKLFFYNSFGINVDASLTRFDGVNADGTTLGLTGVPVPLSIPASPSRGKVAVDSVILDKSSSNLADYLNNRPKYNVYDYQISTTNANNTVWVSDSSVLRCDVRVEIPLYGTAKDYTLETSMESDLTDVTTGGEVKEALFRVYTENGFPLDMRVQLFFEDSITQQVKDSLFVSDDLILPAASVDGAGIVNERVVKISDALFDRARLDAMGTVNRLRIRAEFNSLFEGTQQPDVKILEEYTLYIQFGIQAKVEVNE